MPTFGSLFAGIGGIDLGLERAGWTGRWQVEWDEFCQRVLAHHWPDIPRYGDITTVDWSGVERVDLIAGGFPCQPFSLAGQRRGKDDERWLWPAFAAAVRALRPRYVLVENVPGLLAGHGGMGAVLGDLAELGYDAEWDSIPAAAVGAPHLRYRVWIVAHAVGDAVREQPVGVSGRGGPAVFGLDGAFRQVADSERNDVEGTVFQPGLDGGAWLGGSGPLADSDGAGLEGLGSGSRVGWSPRERAVGPSRVHALPDAERGGCDRRAPDAEWGSFRRAAAIEASTDVRRSGQWLTEPDVGRVAHGVPARVDRLRSLGNAVVPQVVEVIGRRLLDLIEP